MKIKDYGFISLGEMGMDTSGYMIHQEDIYKMIVENCHELPQNLQERSQKTSSVASDEFSVLGRIANFSWASLTQIYSSTLFDKVAPAKREQQEKHRAAVATGYGLGQQLLHAIQHDVTLGCMLRHHPVVVDPSALAWKGFHEHTSFMARHLQTFLGQKQEIVLDIKDHQLVTTTGAMSDLRQKDVLVPLIYATDDTLNLYGQVAKIICQFAQANTVFGIFISCIMPSMDGRRATSLAPDEYVPIISPYPFMEIPPFGY